MSAGPDKYRHAISRVNLGVAAIDFVLSAAY